MGANATVNCSVNLEIPIGADIMQFYVEVKSEMSKKKEDGILSQITEYFRGNKPMK